MEHHMGKEKIEQNIDRTYAFLFHTLGCGYEDATDICVGVLQRRKQREEAIRKKAIEEAEETTSNMTIEK
jgi:hypothetical protein